jgi:hypothetical protein
MVLMMARREAGSCERQAKILKGELENKFMKSRDLIEKLA